MWCMFIFDCKPDIHITTPTHIPSLTTIEDNSEKHIQNEEGIETSKQECPVVFVRNLGNDLFLSNVLLSYEV